MLPGQENRSSCSIVLGRSAHVPSGIRRPRQQGSGARAQEFHPTLPERGDRQADDIETVEEIFAEPSSFDRAFQICVRRSDDPDVDNEWRALAKRADFARLKKPEKLRLQLQLSSPISSRNSVPPRAARITPTLSRSAPCERTASVPEADVS